MAHFTYTAERAGEQYQGAAVAQDRFELYQIIRREGGRVVSVTETAKGWWNLEWWNSKFSFVGEYEKILFARNLGAMLSAGLPLARALAVIERQSKNPRISETISALAAEVRRGETLNSALAKFPRVFSQLFVAMVRAGEEGGDLPKSLTTAADQMDRMYSLHKKIRGALIYPSIIVIAIFIIGAIMMTVVVPTLSATFKELHAELPLSTKFVIAMSDFMSNYTFAAIAIVIAVVAAAYFGLRTTAGKRATDWTLLHMPLFGAMTREINSARTARTLSSLLSSGVDVLTSMEIVRQVVQNSYFRAVLAEASAAVGRGSPLSETFTKHEDLYPAFVGEMMAVGEETGQTNEMMRRLADYYEEEVDRKTKDLSTIIEPLLMILVGAAVGFFAVSMITPIYSLSQNI